MTGSEQLFWAELRSQKATRRSLAVCYALLIASHRNDGPDFWTEVNEALHERLGLDKCSQIERFRALAWSIHDAAAKEAA